MPGLSPNSRGRTDWAPGTCPSWLEHLHRLPASCCCPQASLTLLFLPGFVTDGGSQVDLAALLGGAIPAAHHHSQARLLEDAGIVVVGVPHGPAAQVALGVPVL